MMVNPLFPRPGLLSAQSGPGSHLLPSSAISLLCAHHRCARSSHTLVEVSQVSASQARPLGTQPRVWEGGTLASVAIPRPGPTSRVGRGPAIQDPTARPVATGRSGSGPPLAAPVTGSRRQRGR